MDTFYVLQAFSISFERPLRAHLAFAHKRVPCYNCHFLRGNLCTKFFIFYQLICTKIPKGRQFSVLQMGIQTPEVEHF